MKNKLKGLPRIYSLMLEGDEGIKRKNSFIKKVSDLNLDYEIIEVKRYPECGTIVEGNTHDHILHFNPGQCKTTAAVSANHLRMWREWISSSSEDEKWALFCEGDISFDTVEFWPFSWTDFMSIIPSDAKVVQLCVLRSEPDFDLTLVERSHQTWGANMYLVSREYAERKIRRHCYTGNENLFNIATSVVDFGGYEPCLPEDILFVNDRFDEKVKFVDSRGAYSIPLFVEDLSLVSYFENDREDADSEKRSHMHTMKLWKDYNKEVQSWNK